MSMYNSGGRMDRAVKNDHLSQCKIDDCNYQTYLKSGLCTSHNNLRRKSGDPLVPIVSFKNRKYTLPVRWLMARYAEDTPEEGLGSLRAALISTAADLQSPFRDPAFYLLSDPTDEDRLRTYSKVVLLSAISIHHADILPNDVCYHRQVGRQVMLMDRSRGAGRFLGVRAMDYFGKLVVSSCARPLTKGVNELVDECPYWFR